MQAGLGRSAGCARVENSPLGIFRQLPPACTGAPSVRGGTSSACEASGTGPDLFISRSPTRLGWPTGSTSTGTPTAIR